MRAGDETSAPLPSPIEVFLLTTRRTTALSRRVRRVPGVQCLPSSGRERSASVSGVDDGPAAVRSNTTKLSKRVLVNYFNFPGKRVRIRVNECRPGCFCLSRGSSDAAVTFMQQSAIPLPRVRRVRPSHFLLDANMKVVYLIRLSLSLLYLSDSAELPQSVRDSEGRKERYVECRRSLSPSAPQATLMPQWMLGRASKRTIALRMSRGTDGRRGRPEKRLRYAMQTRPSHPKA